MWLHGHILPQIDNFTIFPESMSSGVCLHPPILIDEPTNEKKGKVYRRVMQLYAAL
jgi:hypothetical protein